MKIITNYFFLVLFFVLLPIHNVFSITKVDITRSNISPIPIAIEIYSKQNKFSCDKVYSIVTNDLLNSGLFRLINKDAYIENDIKVTKTPHFSSWRQINATFLIIVEIKKTSQNNIDIELKLWDVFSQKQRSNKVISGNISNLRSISHKIADEIYTKLTGEEGYFDTKIAYISLYKDGYGNKVRKLAVMDQDGENHQLLTNGKNIILTPRFSPDSQSITYLEYQQNEKPKLYSINLHKRVSRSLGSFPEMSYAPRYINKQHILMSIEKKGISNIYMLNLQNMQNTQITFCSSVCTSPSLSPNNKHIVFNSDMGGDKQLYTMNFNGDNIKRITFGKGSYSSPIWSPRGDLIAFTKTVPGEGFYIGVIKPDGSGERLIANGWLVEGPTWAPNGRVIMFEKEVNPGSGTNIYSIDITGHNERIIETPFNASDASWSNLL